MAKIEWDRIGEHFYEGALDRGVLYGPEGKGVAWNGLVSFEENHNNTSEEIYYDGIKINDIVTIGSFSGTLRAFTYPEEFRYAEGVFEDQTGLYITHQPPYRFGLSYRTKKGNDLEGLDYGYKIHLLYNLTAIGETITRQTLTLEEDPTDFAWKIYGIPDELFGRRPTCHIIIDSTDMDEWLLQDIEDIIYGDADSDPILPDLDGFLTFIRKWQRLIITDNGDGTWTADAKNDPDIIMTTPTEFLITADTILYHNPTTYDIWSSEKNEEDIH